MNIQLKTLSKVAAAMASLSLLGCGGGTETTTNVNVVNPTEPVSDWRLVWSDEFDGTAIDSSNWTHEVNCLGGGNQEKQCYTDSAANSFVADGVLNIVALPAEEGAEQPYTSARLNSRNKADFQYGRIEVRAKFPAGQGTWPAAWMMPTDEVYGGWPKSGEIDIVEAVNLKAARADGTPESHIYGTIHYGKDAPNNSSTGAAYMLPDGANPADDFHTYTIEWQEGEIRWYMDDYLYATQRASEVRTNSNGDAVGLAHRGWFTEYYDMTTGELEAQYGPAPFDQDFHLILNLAIGGNWPENVNELGIDHDALANGVTYQIDYVRVYKCDQNTATGSGCETVRQGYDSYEDALLEGEAPIPSPPSTGIATPLYIFTDEMNPNWPAWDCCGGSTPMVVEDDPERGNAVEFYVGAQPTVNGFISRATNITDPNGTATPFDASPMLENGSFSFDMKVISPPNNPDSTWLVKVESNGASTFAELPLTASNEGAAPAVGVWQTYTFPLSVLSDAGLDLAAIDVVMVFPAWDTGDGAVYRLDNVQFTQEGGVSPSLTMFEDGENPAWPMWDCCGGSTPQQVDDESAYGTVAEFSIGAAPTVMGFITRPAAGGGDEPFDASSIIADGVVQFDMKVVSPPANADSFWLFKIESDNAATFAELPLTASQEGVAPVTGEWQTYTFTIQQLVDAGLDPSAIDVVMIFPAWDTGNGAVYRVDNAKIYVPGAGGPAAISLFDEQARDGWVIWDCCGGSTPTVEMDDAPYGNVIEFTIGGAPTVMGVITRSAVGGGDMPVDASALLANGVVRFDMKVVSAPLNPDSFWLFKIESNGGDEFAELPLTDSMEGMAPTTGEWQTYTFPLQTLFNAGLDISAIDVLMVFPAWGTGDGAVYRVDNIEIVVP